MHSFIHSFTYFIYVLYLQEWEAYLECGAITEFCVCCILWWCSREHVVMSGLSGSHGGKMVTVPPKWHLPVWSSMVWSEGRETFAVTQKQGITMSLGKHSRKARAAHHFYFLFLGVFVAMFLL